MGSGINIYYERFHFEDMKTFGMLYEFPIEFINRLVVYVPEVLGDLNNIVKCDALGFQYIDFSLSINSNAPFYDLENGIDDGSFLKIGDRPRRVSSGIIRYYGDEWYYLFFNSVGLCFKCDQWYGFLKLVGDLNGKDYLKDGI